MWLWLFKPLNRHSRRIGNLFACLLQNALANQLRNQKALWLVRILVFRKIPLPFRQIFHELSR